MPDSTPIKLVKERGLVNGYIEAVDLEQTDTDGLVQEFTTAIVAYGEEARRVILLEDREKLALKLARNLIQGLLR